MPQLNDDFFEIVKATHKEKPKQEDIVKLKQFLVEHPDYCSRFGNLAVQVEMHICENAFRHSQVSVISLDKYCQKMRTDLGFNEASALEKSLIEHVVLCWLRLYTAELRYEMNMQTSLSLAQGEYWEKKLGYNQKRYLRSVETLTKVRRLMQKAPTPVMNTLIMQNPSPATNDLLQAFSQGLGGK